MATATPHANLAHQGWDGTDKNTGLLNPPKDIFEMRAVQHKHVWHSEMPAGKSGQLAWGFADRGFDKDNSVTGDGSSKCTGVPGPVFRLRYGRSHLVRIYNELPATKVDAVSALGFGTSTIATHMHNHHTPSESDGGPLYYNYAGKFWDHHYPNLYAGINQGFVSPKAGVRGDYREALGSLWFHDHKHDFTSQNVYAGLFGACPIYDEVDTGDETVVGTTGLRFPSHSQDAQSYPYEFDVPMFFHDRQRHDPALLQGAAAQIPHPHVQRRPHTFLLVVDAPGRNRLHLPAHDRDRQRRQPVAARGQPDQLQAVGGRAF
jgi:hypothetical protein